MKLFVPAPRGPRSVHINDYHFFTLFHQANLLNSSQQTRDHVVVFDDFDDFDGLAECVAQLRNQDPFAYGGLDWGWNSESEIFPKETAKASASLSGAAINELIYLVKNADSMPTRKLVSNGLAKPFLDRLKQVRAVAKSIPGDASFPFTFMPKKLPVYLKFDLGKQGTSGFVYPASGNKEGIHLHAFFSDGANEQTEFVMVTSVQLTCNSKNHLKQSQEPEKWQRPVGSRDRDDAEILKAMLATVRRAVATVEDQEQDDEPKKTPAEEKEWEAKEVTAQSLATKYDVDVFIIEALLEQVRAEPGAEASDYDVLDMDSPTFLEIYGEDIEKLRLRRRGKK